jgi:hypothetical protein
MGLGLRFISKKSHTRPLRRRIMSESTAEQNKAFALEAWETLFNKKDYVAAKKLWSDNYIQHSAHIPPGREGLFDLVRSAPRRCATRTHASWPRATF